MWQGKPCGRPLYDGEKCICHSEKEDKNPKTFQRMINPVFAGSEPYCDLVGFIFPDTGYTLPSVYDKDTFFCGAKFLGRADFWQSKFRAQAFFGDAKFLKEAYFRRASFLGPTDFSKAVFEGTANFRNARFAEDADFSFAKFYGRADFYRAKCVVGSSLTFDGEANRGEVFSSVADLLHFTFDKPERILFRKISLERCKFLETDISGVQFLDVTWDKKRKLFFLKRNAVYDESHPDNRWLIWKNPKTTEPKHEPPRFQYHLIAQLYRRLQQNYINNYRYTEASDFYVGEQEMMRKAKGKVWQYLSTNNAYRIISYYGENYWLPLFWLAFVLLLFPAILLYDGVNLNPALQNPAITKTINYGWSWSPGDFLPVNGDSRRDYWEAFVANFSLIAYSRSDIGKYLPESHTRFIVTIESLIVIALLAFFLLALRRKYKRKTF